MAPISQVWCACSETPRRWRHTVASGCACRRRSSRNGSNAALIAVPASAASSRDCPSGRASSMTMDRARLAGKASPPWRRSVQPARACGAPHRLRPNTRRPASWSRRRGVEAGGGGEVGRPPPHVASGFDVSQRWARVYETMRPRRPTCQGATAESPPYGAFVRNACQPSPPVALPKSAPWIGRRTHLQLMLVCCCQG